MGNFQNVITDIFDRGVTRGKMDLADERATIAAAKRGDNNAIVTLMYAYAYALRKAMRGYMKATVDTSREGMEDARMQVVTGLIEAIQKFDPDRHDRLAAVVNAALINETKKAAEMASGFRVPDRMLSRYFQIMREADGNEFHAAAMAPDYAMSRSAFLAIHSALRGVEGLEAMMDAARGEGGSYEPVVQALSGVVRTTEEIAEERLLVEAAFAAVDDMETRVVRLAYGFDDYNALSDGEVAERLGLSRQKAQRTRTTALGKMRKALHVEL